MAAHSQEHGFQSVKAKERFAPGSTWLPLRCSHLCSSCHALRMAPGGVGMGHCGQSAASFQLLPGEGQRNQGSER